MTWQVPGAKVEIAQFPPSIHEPPAYAVIIEMENGARRAFGSDTALALAAVLVDAAHRIDERQAHDKRLRESVARQMLTPPPFTTRGIQDDIRAAKKVVDHQQRFMGDGPLSDAQAARMVAEGYAADIEGH